MENAVLVGYNTTSSLFICLSKSVQEIALAAQSTDTTVVETTYLSVFLDLGYGTKNCH